MPAALKRREEFPQVAHGVPPVRPARASDQPVSTPVHHQHARLHQAFAERPRSESYPGALKLAILVGGPLVLWAGIFSGAMAVAHAVAL
jgi:hypothetical protein